VNNQAKTDNKNIFVSYYDAKDYLAVVVSNYFTETSQNVTLDLSKFKQVVLTTGQDVWNGGEVTGHDGKFALTLPAGRMKLLVFKRR
jgi:O-glycosyl hydrolase